MIDARVHAIRSISGKTNAATAAPRTMPALTCASEWSPSCTRDYAENSGRGTRRSRMGPNVRTRTSEGSRPGAMTGLDGMDGDEEAQFANLAVP